MLKASIAASKQAIADPRGEWGGRREWWQQLWSRYERLSELWSEIEQVSLQIENFLGEIEGDDGWTLFLDKHEERMLWRPDSVGRQVASQFAVKTEYVFDCEDCAMFSTLFLEWEHWGKWLPNLVSVEALQSVSTSFASRCARVSVDSARPGPRESSKQQQYDDLDSYQKSMVSARDGVGAMDYQAALAKLMANEIDYQEFARLTAEPEDSDATTTTGRDDGNGTTPPKSHPSSSTATAAGSLLRMRFKFPGSLFSKAQEYESIVQLRAFDLIKERRAIVISFCTPADAVLKRLHAGKIDAPPSTYVRHECDGCLVIRWLSPQRLVLQQIQRGTPHKPPHPSVGMFPHTAIESALQGLAKRHFVGLNNNATKPKSYVDSRHEAEAAAGGGGSPQGAGGRGTRDGGLDFFEQVKHGIANIEGGWLQPGFRQQEQQVLVEQSRPTTAAAASNNVRTLSNGVLSLPGPAAGQEDPRMIRRATTGVVNLARTDFTPWQERASGGGGGGGGGGPPPRLGAGGGGKPQLTRCDSQGGGGGGTFQGKKLPHLVSIPHTKSGGPGLAAAPFGGAHQQSTMNRSVTWAFSEWPNNIDLQTLVEEMRSAYGVKLSSRRQWMTVYPKCFEGGTLVEWVVQNLPESGRDRRLATKVGQLLLQNGHIQHVRGEYIFGDNQDLYQFSIDASGGNIILNQSAAGDNDFPIASNASTLDPITVAHDLAGMACSLIAPFTSTKSTNEFERSLHQQRESPAFKIFEEQAARLSQTVMDNSNWTREQCLSFWINIYNTMVVHIHMRRGLCYTAKQRLHLLVSSQYIICGHLLTLGEISYILRGGVSPTQKVEIGNGKSKVFMPEVNFGKNDPRASLILKPHQTERLAVFALTTGTQSGAVLRAYSPSTLYEQLESGAAEYLGQQIRFMICPAPGRLPIAVSPNKVASMLFTKGVVHSMVLPKLLHWYQPAFGSSKHDVAVWACEQMDKDKSNHTKYTNLGFRFGLLGAHVKETATSVQFSEYQWTFHFAVATPTNNNQMELERGVSGARTASVDGLSSRTVSTDGASGSLHQESRKKSPLTNGGGRPVDLARMNTNARVGIILPNMPVNGNSTFHHIGVGNPSNVSGNHLGGPAVNGGGEDNDPDDDEEDKFEDAQMDEMVPVDLNEKGTGGGGVVGSSGIPPTSPIAGIPECDDEHDSDNDNDNTRDTLMRGRRSSISSVNSVDRADEERSKIAPKLNDFQLVKVLGRGSFGKVVLVNRKIDGAMFALKALKKKGLTGRKRDQAMVEQEILSTVRHPFLLHLKFAFQTATRLYLGMEYCTGGSLQYYLAKMPGKKLSAESTLFYASELVAAIVYLHSLQIVYRDLKPDNTLIADDGHIKLVDFGLSVTNVKSPTDARDTVGTPNYVSPEVLTAEIPGFNAGYGTSCDWWSFGVMLYEMLLGVTPFVEKHQLKLFWKILHHEVEWPAPGISEDAKDLIGGLLQRDPNVRYSYTQVKNHAFFSSISWEDVLRKRLEPPYLPKTFARASQASFSNLPTNISKMPAAETPEDNFLDGVILAFDNFTGAGKVDNFTFIAGEQTRKY